jgi:hypothetical protein
MAYGADPPDDTSPSAGEDGNTRSSPSEAEQDEFLDEKLLSEQGVHPRMRLTRVH